MTTLAPVAAMSHLKDANWVKRFNACNKVDDKISLLRAYNTKEPQEEAVIQLLLDRLDPPRSSWTHIDQVKREQELEEAKGVQIDSKEQEAKWQEKLDEAYALDKAQEAAVMKGHIEEIQRLFPDIDIESFNISAAIPKISIPHPLAAKQEDEKKAIVTTISTDTVVEVEPGFITPDLSKLAGLSKVSVGRLNASGVYTQAEFFALNENRAMDILKSQAVVQKFKDKFVKE